MKGAPARTRRVTCVAAKGSEGESRGINPFNYLVDVLARVQVHPANAIDELLAGPWAARD